MAEKMETTNDSIIDYEKELKGLKRKYFSIMKFQIMKFFLTSLMHQIRV